MGSPVDLIVAPVAGGTPQTLSGTTLNVFGRLGKAVGVNLNALASTTIFTVPAGVTRCNVAWVQLNNYSISASTASVQLGATGGSDFRATAANANASTTETLQVLPGAIGAGNTANFYTTGTAFQATVTIVQGAAATCDVQAWGWYE